LRLSSIKQFLKRRNSMTTKRDNILTMAGLVAVLAVVMVLAYMASGCDDGCSPEETRCDGVMVQLCDGDGNWKNYSACSEVSVLTDAGLVDVQMVCCEVNGEHLCELPDDCLPGGDQ
jgi:hypothetical protein